MQFVNGSARRLFMVDPKNIHEHPADLPVKANDIPNGSISGWHCFAPNFRGDPHKVIGPFIPMIQRPYDDDRVCIQVYISEYDNSYFWYHQQGDPNNKTHALPDRNCWHQSGSTLRFIREGKYEPSFKSRERIMAFIMQSLQGRDMKEWRDFLSALSKEEKDWAMEQLSNMLYAATSR